MFTLRRKAHYVPALRALVAESDFSTPQRRARILRALANLVERENVISSDVSMRQRGGEMTKLARNARALWDAQMHAASMEQPGALNVFTPNEQRYNVRRTAAKPHAPDDDVCLLSILVTTRVSFAENASPITVLDCLSQDVPDAVYFLYTPDIGESMTLTDARALFQRLCKT